MSMKSLNPNAERAGKGTALMISINAAKGLQSVMSTNLGPRGTCKMLVGGAGDIKLTKDGSVLLHQMQIQHPTASLIARTATAQDDITGDGTTSTILFIGQLLKEADKYIQEGVHPRVITEGFEIAKVRAADALDALKHSAEVDRELLMCVARTSLRSKLRESLADNLTAICTDAVRTIQREGQEVDLHMVELMSMRSKTASETKLVRGLVLDHGGRGSDMKTYLENVYVLNCNVSLEYEKTEINSGFFYSSAEERERMVRAERKFVEDRVDKIIALKNKVCNEETPEFMIVNMKGIDPPALERLQAAGILALRRAKRRNLERLALAAGGYSVNSVDDLTPECLGRAGKVYEQTLGEDKYTFIEDVKNPFSVTILIKGPNEHTISQLKDAVRDGLRAVKNTIDDKCVLPGGGACEVAVSRALRAGRDSVDGRARYGVDAFADALLVIPKTLAVNSGFDAQDSVVKLEDEHKKGRKCGLDVFTGEPMDPVVTGVWDNYRVKKQLLHSATVIATNLLLVDEMLKAGKNIKGNNPMEENAAAAE